MHLPSQKTVFEYDDYRTYLGDRLATSGPTRGARSRLAQALGCQNAFISQVIGGQAHINTEHGIEISRFLSHTAEESHFFMMLLGHGRAGTERLRRYYTEQLEALRNQRRSITARLKTKPAMSIQNEMTYYSAWYFAAIHVMLSVPRFQTEKAIALHLGLPLAQVAACLAFLESLGLALREGDRYRIGENRIHIGKESAMRMKHHMNWRVQSMQRLSRQEKEDLFFSSVFSLSEEDARAIRDLLVNTVAHVEPIVSRSPEEMVYCLAMDFYRI